MNAFRSISTVAFIAFFIAMSLVLIYLNGRLRRNQRLIVVATLVLTISGVAVWVTGFRLRDESPKASFANSIAPQEVAFERASYDFSELTAGLNGEFQVVVFNHSDRLKSVTEVSGSCSCMEITPMSFDIPPHSQQVVNIKFSAFSLGFNRFFAGIHVGESEVAKCEMRFSGVRSLRLLPLSGIVGSLSDSDTKSSLIHQLSFDGVLPGPIQSVRLVPGPSDTPLVLGMVNTVLDGVNELTLAISLCDDVHARGFYYETVDFEVVLADQTIVVSTEIGVDIVD
ncbi:hypothetical protein SH528x_001039 [Novipirellula sp. SH528]|uniref:hypothetical protein n=1 Tax=Novipirellula sp. SH528 TaxID=3454466 RepID=UPI003FA06813